MNTAHYFGDFHLSGVNFIDISACTERPAHATIFSYHLLLLSLLFFFPYSHYYCYQTLLPNQIFYPWPLNIFPNTFLSIKPKYTHTFLPIEAEREIKACPARYEAPRYITLSKIPPLAPVRPIQSSLFLFLPSALPSVIMEYLKPIVMKPATVGKIRPRRPN